MLKKFLLVEVLLLGGMIALYAHQQLPPTTVTVGETTLEIKTEEAVEALPTSPTPLVKMTGGLVFPVSGFTAAAVISVFGDPRGKTRKHQGIDIKAPRGTDLVAVTDGFIERIRESGSGGKQLYLRDGTGRLFYYAHLDSWTVEEYQAVKAGDVIGTVGDTGNARGTTPHLHFEILLGKDRKAIDPITYFTGV